MDTQEFGCSDSLPEWKFCILWWITETVMTELSEYNVTYVKTLQTMASMNYFDSSRENLTYILNGSQ
jgi:hypothetical protein